MKKFFLLLSFAFYLFNAHGVLSMEIHSVTPPEISPGAEVTVKGADFEDEIVVVLGDRAIKPFYTTKNLLKFTAPADIEPGTYRLYVKTKKGMAYPIGVAFKKREIAIKNFTPESVDMCGSQRRITVTGENLGAIKKVSANGTEINDFQAADKQLTLEIPEDAVRNAVHVINIYFYDEARKIQDLINIKLNSTPFIEKAETLTASVNSYEMKISGKNFVKGLRLFAGNDMIIEKTKEEQSVVPYEWQFSPKRYSKATPMYDRFEYLSCSELIYIRYPLSSDNKRIEIYIENPSGARGNTYIITAP